MEEDYYIIQRKHNITSLWSYLTLNLPYGSDYFQGWHGFAIKFDSRESALKHLSYMLEQVFLLDKYYYTYSVRRVSNPCKCKSNCPKCPNRC